MVDRPNAGDQRATQPNMTDNRVWVVWGLIAVPVIALIGAAAIGSVDVRLALLGTAFVFGWSQLPSL